MKKEVKTIDQMTIAKKISQELPEVSLNDIQKIILREQELTMFAVCKGYKVVKKNYLTIYPVDIKEKVITSPLNGEKYQIKAHQGVSVRVGAGFKSIVSNKEMPSKLCRSVTKNIEV